MTCAGFTEFAAKQYKELGRQEGKTMKGLELATQSTSNGHSYIFFLVQG